MAYNAEETKVAEGIITQITSIGTDYNTRNVILVPDFVLPPKRYAKILVEVKSPTIAPYGAAGGSYLHRIFVDIGVFRRTSADPHGEYDYVTKECNETARTIRRNLIDRSLSVLHIYLYDTGQEQEAKILTIDGSPIKDCVWAAFRVWGMVGQRVEDFKAS